MLFFCLNGVCLERFIFIGEDGELEIFVMSCGELNEKLVKLFLILFLLGVFLLFGVRGVSRVGLFV